MKVEDMVEIVQDCVDETEIISERRAAVRTDRDRFIEVLQNLRDQDITHISTITGTDLGSEIELIYHMSSGNGILLDVVISIPKNDREVPTVTDIYPGAILYERELTDMFGIEVADHPAPGRLILPDDWPEGKYPLIRDQDLDYEELVNSPISEIKDVASEKNVNYEKLLEMERKGKNRKSLNDWLRKQMESEEK